MRHNIDNNKTDPTGELIERSVIPGQLSAESMK